MILGEIVPVYSLQLIFSSETVEVFLHASMYQVISFSKGDRLLALWTDGCPKVKKKKNALLEKKVRSVFYSSQLSHDKDVSVGLDAGRLVAAEEGSSRVGEDEVVQLQNRPEYVFGDAKQYCGMRKGPLQTCGEPSGRRRPVPPRWSQTWHSLDCSPGSPVLCSTK